MKYTFRLTLRELKKALREAQEAYRLLPTYSLKLKQDFKKGKITKAQFENAQKVGFRGRDMHEWIMFYNKKISRLEELIEERKKRKHLIRIS